jgi:hypothetical protein
LREPEARLPHPEAAERSAMNPFEVQKKMFEEWERNLASYLDKTMRQPEFMQLVGRNLELAMTLQGAVKGHVQKALKALAVPTEEELAGLYRTVNDLESRMLDLEEELEDLKEAAGAAAGGASPDPGEPPGGEGRAPARPAAKARRARGKATAAKPAARKAAPRRPASPKAGASRRGR